MKIILWWAAALALLMAHEATGIWPSISEASIGWRVCAHEMDKNTRQPVATDRGCHAIDVNQWKPASALLAEGVPARQGRDRIVADP